MIMIIAIRTVFPNFEKLAAEIKNKNKPRNNVFTGKDESIMMLPPIRNIIVDNYIYLEFI